MADELDKAYTPSDSLLYIKEQAGEALRNPYVSIPLGVAATSYAGAPVIQSGLQRLNLLQRYLGEKGQRASTIIQGFYAPGAKKGKLARHHFKHNPNLESVKLLKTAQADYLEKELAGDYRPYKKGRPAKDTIRHKWGHAKFKLDEINHHLKNMGEKPIGRQVMPGVYDYSNIDTQDAKNVQKIQRVVNSGRLTYGEQSVAQINFGVDEQAAKQQVGVKPDDLSQKVGAKGRKYRHEIGKSEFTKHVHGMKVNPANITKAGFSQPVQTSVGNIFKGVHKDAAKAWNVPDYARTTVSTITNNSDKTAVTKQLKKEFHFRGAKNVVNSLSTKQLRSPKQVRKAITEFTNKEFASGGRKDFRLHPSLYKKSRTELIDDFMNRYKVKGSKLHINFSPDFKPHYFMGGTNANAVLWKAKKRYTLPKGANVTRGGVPVKGIMGSKVYHDVLISDRYDMLSPEKYTGGRAQKRRHFTTHHITDYQKTRKGKTYKGLYRPTTYKSDIGALKQAIKTGDFTNVRKHAKNLGKKSIPYLKSRYGAKHPLVALVKAGLTVASKRLIK